MEVLLSCPLKSACDWIAPYLTAVVEVAVDQLELVASALSSVSFDKPVLCYCDRREVFRR